MAQASLLNPTLKTKHGNPIDMSKRDIIIQNKFLPGPSKDQKIIHEANPMMKHRDSSGYDKFIKFYQTGRD
jgi:hypothetical protein